MKVCLFAGTFDPITVGHYHTVTGLLNDYDKVIVAIGVNPDKTPFFCLEDRLNFLRLAFSDFDRVEVDSYDGLTVDYMKKRKVVDLVRGIRNGVDLEYEQKNHALSKEIYPLLNTIYVSATSEDKNISSTSVRKLIEKGEDFESFVPKTVYEAVKKAVVKLKENK